MGRLLDLARQTDNIAFLPEQTRESFVDSGSVKCLAILPHPAAPTEWPFDALASDVLDVIVKASQTIPHSSMVNALMARGHDKTSAQRAIARCQKWRWIEHDLEIGYVQV